MTPPAAPRLALVADDDADVRSVVAEYLGSHGLHVLQAENGLQALLHIKHHRPGVIVLDLGMPRLGGVDVLKRIRVFDPTIRVAVITGDLDPETHRRARALGAVEVLPKPVDLARLIAALGLAATPAGAVLSPDGEPAAAPLAPQTPATGGGSVLVVDDDVDVRAMLEELMTSLGHRSRSAPDGAAALRAIAKAAPDVILLDIDMPGLSGTDALPAIKALAPEAKVIMVSGTTSVETSKRALAQGAFDYVLKPVDVAYLARSIEIALSMKQVGI
jgi:DNA-binding NtrC family response regulator